MLALRMTRCGTVAVFNGPTSDVVEHVFGNVALNPVRHLTPHDAPRACGAIKVAVLCAVCRSEALR